MKRFLRFPAALAGVIVLAVLAVFTARLAFPLPDISSRSTSQAIPTDPKTPLGQLQAEAETTHPGKSGVLPLQNGTDAFVSRLKLVAAAQESIDAQYYIWHDDTSGILLLDSLHKAAQRGVRVRLLLDDNGVPGLDSLMAALNALENFEIRLFNPSTVRQPKMLGYAFDFFRMNRRMHNKSLIADGAAVIIGGRNIGDEYFRVSEDAFYVDMDVLATGAIVPETAEVFDKYWNSSSVFEVENIIDGAGDMEAFRTRVSEVTASPEATKLLGDMRNAVHRYTQGSAAIEWTNVQLVADDPVKGLGIATRDQLLINQLSGILGNIEQRLELVSAYFVPGEKGTDFFADLVDAGKDVRILTNAMNTTDVLMVHAGYTRYRRRLLKEGVLLFELKTRGQMSGEAGLQIMPLGFSGASLHAKIFAVDGMRIFIGSFNFDPRSAILNCEMGFLIDSPTLAQNVSAEFDGPIARASYRPELTSEDKLIWRESLTNGDTLTYQEEPDATWFQRTVISIVGLLPVEWLL